MVIRAKRYRAVHPDRRLAGRTPAAVDAYLAEWGRHPGLNGGPFRQAFEKKTKPSADSLGGRTWQRTPLPNLHPKIHRCTQS
jgi:hypothetical protein